jgi:hypothetical protein
MARGESMVKNFGASVFAAKSEDRLKRMNKSFFIP